MIYACKWSEHDKNELLQICNSGGFLEDVSKIIWEMELVVAVKKNPIPASDVAWWFSKRNKNPDRKKKMIAQIDTAIRQLESYSPALLGHILRDDSEHQAAKAYLHLLECLKKPYAPTKRNDRGELVKGVRLLAKKYDIKIYRSVDGGLCKLLEIITRVSGVDYGVERLVREVCEMPRP